MIKLSVKKLSALKIIFLCSVFIYFSQGVLYARGSVVSQVALLVILIVSGYFFLKSMHLFIKRKNAFVLFWTLFLLLNVLGFLITLEPFNYNYQSQLKSILLFSLSFYAAYYLARYEALSERDLIVFFLLTLPVLLISFELQRNSIIAMRLSDNENVVNNVAYNFVALIPYVFLIRKRLVSVFIAAVMIYTIIEGAKRGAILVGALGFFIFFIYLIRTAESRHKIKNYVGAAIGISVLTVYAVDHYLSNEFLLQRMETMNEGSGRADIFSNLLANWSSQDSVQNILFGSGFMSTVNFSGIGNLAHNDWLELLTNYGLFGVFLYLSIFSSGFSRVIKITSKDSERDETKKYRLIAFTILSMCLLKTMFSMVFNTFSSIYYVILLGFVLAKLDNSQV